MSDSDELVVPLSLAKLALVAVGSAIFVVLGIWMYIDADPARKFMGAFGSIFFGFTFLYAIWKLFDDSPGLVLNSQGIFDNSSGASVGMIPWADISSFSISKVRSQRFLTIHVKNPEDYVKRGNFFRQLSNRISLSWYGSPVQISSVSLKTNFDELVAACHDYLKKYGT